MSCQNPGQNLTTTVREQFIWKPLKRQEFITQNKMVPESRLIQFFIYESSLNKKKNYFRANMKKSTDL